MMQLSACAWRVRSKRVAIRRYWWIWREPGFALLSTWSRCATAQSAPRSDQKTIAAAGFACAILSVTLGSSQVARKHCFLPSLRFEVELRSDATILSLRKMIADGQTRPAA